MKPIERAAFLVHAETFAFERKVREAQDVIAQSLALPDLGKIYLSCSWGKDSTVMLHLVQSIFPDVPVVHVHDENSDLISNYSEVSGSYRSRWPIHQYIPIPVPMLGPSVPEVMREFSSREKYESSFMGLRREENGARKWQLMKTGAIHAYAVGGYRVCPLVWWSWKDVWAYTISRQLPYLKEYDHPFNSDRSRSRTSSICAKRLLDGTHGGLQFGRIAVLKQTSPEYYALLKDRCPALASQA